MSNVECRDVTPLYSGRAMVRATALDGSRVSAPVFGGHCWKTERDGSITTEARYVACEFVSSILHGEAGIHVTGRESRSDTKARPGWRRRTVSKERGCPWITVGSTTTEARETRWRIVAKQSCANAAPFA